MKITAIVVLYHDDTEEASVHVGRIAQQVDEICLVDNSPADCAMRFRHIANATYIPLHENKGIAAAQNEGIRHALAHEADYILLADPDTAIPDGAIDQLLSTYHVLAKEGMAIGGIGSRARDASTHEYYPLRSNLIQEWTEKEFSEVTYLMNSISLYPASLFQQEGMMDEGLFIDGVDSEFCWRASAHGGYRFFIDHHVVIDHTLGMGAQKIGGKYRSITPPSRMYYQYRNFFWLRKRPYTPKQWKRENGFRYFAKAIYYPLFKSPRIEYIKNIYRGIKDGLKYKKQ